MIPPLIHKPLPPPPEVRSSIIKLSKLKAAVDMPIKTDTVVRVSSAFNAFSALLLQSVVATAGDVYSKENL